MKHKILKIIHLRLRKICSSLLGFYLLSSLAQDQIRFRQLSVQNGLSQNSAISITQDGQGYLWIATQNGLNRYDGYSFRKYDFNYEDITRPEYSYLGKVYTDRIGNVWTIPQDQNLYRYSTTENDFLPTKGITNASAIYQDASLRYWIGTNKQGLIYFDSSLVKPTTIITPELLQGRVNHIAGLPDGSLVVCSQNKVFQTSVPKEKPPSDSLNLIVAGETGVNYSAALSTPTGRIWISTYGNGLYYSDSDITALTKFRAHGYADPIPENLNILDLQIDSKNRLWVATYGEGLYLIDSDKKSITHFTPDKNNPRALHYKDILCVYEDYSGTLWFGTDGAGLSFYDDTLEKFNSITTQQTPDNINIDVVRALAVEDNGDAWIGTSGKGLTQYEPAINSWRTFTTVNSQINSDRIMSLLHDGNNLWIGTQGQGISLYNEIEGFRKLHLNSLGNQSVWELYQDSKNRIWLGTQNMGLIQLNDQKKVQGTHLTDIPNIRVVTEDLDGNLWVGTDMDGIFFLNTVTGNIKHLRKAGSENGLTSNQIKSLYYSPQNVLWIGTNGRGLFAYDTKAQKFYQFTENEGLANNVIYSILPDQMGALWLSSNKGITRFEPKLELKEFPTIRNFDNYAGLATEFNTGAYFKSKNGDLYFGGLDGFYWFNPSQINTNTTLPHTTITGLEVLDVPIALTSEIILPYNENTLTFSFSAMEHSLPEKNQYQYRLNNYEEEWIDAGNSTSARYTGLPPGDYRFQVKSSNYDGLWNHSPASLEFTIRPPWYFNTVSKTIYILLFFALLLGIYQYFQGRWKMRMKLRLKEEETIRFKQLNEYKTKLYTDIAHEFRTPLTLISGPVDAKLTQGKLSDIDYAHFTTIKRNTHRLTSLVDQLLELARLEKGKLNLHVALGDLRLFLHTLADAFSYRAVQTGRKFSVWIDPVTDVWYDEDVLEKIVSNLMSNALKYSPNGGEIFLSATLDPDAKPNHSMLLLKVGNTVEQLDDLPLDQLFERFYQKDEYAPGAGIGLSLVRELLRYYGGHITAETSLDQLIFTVTLPVEKAAFKPEDLKLHQNSRETQSHMETVVFKIEDNEAADEFPILLIVEDNKDVREFIRRSLQQTYHILEAEHGQDGVDKAIEFIPDIILSDIRMPVMDGIQLSNILKSDERTSHIPLVLLTADGSEENELQGLESGADDFITKPFQLRILEKKLSNLIELRKFLRTRYSQEFILKPKDISLTSTDEQFLNRLQACMDTHLSDPDFTADLFARNMAMSRVQLHRKLLAFTGLSTTAFIRSQRLKQALHLLQTSDATVNEIAYTVGFNTPSYFIKCFKEVYHKTPKYYLDSIDNK